MFTFLLSVKPHWCLIYQWSNHIDVLYTNGQTTLMSYIPMVKPHWCLIYQWSNHIDVLYTNGQTTLAFASLQYQSTQLIFMNEIMPENSEQETRVYVPLENIEDIAINLCKVDHTSRAVNGLSHLRKMFWIILTNRYIYICIYIYNYAIPTIYIHNATVCMICGYFPIYHPPTFISPTI